jgi:putative flippase GtrA
VVGGASTLVTIGTFNLLAHVGSPPLLGEHPVTAYGVGMVIGLVVNYLGNRFWAFGTTGSQPLWQQVLVFLVVNGIAFAIPAGCLAVSRYVLGLDSVVADNVSANGIGLVLATITRWFLYRVIVFADAGD